MTEDIPQPDRIEGAPHPRDTRLLFGQEAAERDFLAAHATGRLHHGWLLTGPRGVGKATLAWRIATFLLSAPEGGGGLFGADSAPASLDVDPENPVARRIHAGSEPRLFVLRRAWDDEKKRLKTVITVDEVRRMKSFFALSSADGGARVAIVDSADEMNPSAANALLKLLEEPPAGVTILLVSHQPSGLLPTIRSRCRELRLHPLPAQAIAAALEQAGIAVEDEGPALSALSGGSVGEAIRLTNLDGLRDYAAIVRLFATLPRLDRPSALALAAALGARGAEARLDLALTLFDLFLSRLARSAVTGPPAPEGAPGEAELFARLATSPHAARGWADLHQSQGARARHGKAVNLDPAALILDMVFKIDETAHRLSAR